MLAADLLSNNGFEALENKLVDAPVFDVPNRDERVVPCAAVVPVPNNDPPVVAAGLLNSPVPVPVLVLAPNNDVPVPAVEAFWPPNKPGVLYL